MLFAEIRIFCAGKPDEVELDLENKIDEAFDNNIPTEDVLKMLVKLEVGGFTKFFEHKGKALCGYDIFLDLRVDRFDIRGGYQKKGLNLYNVN